MFLVNPKSKQPIYEQLVEQLRRQLFLGVVQAGQALPSVRQLATELGINPNTIQKAYSELLSRGEIYSVRGKGNFVSGDQTGIRNKKLEQIRGEMLALLRQAKEFGASTEQLHALLTSLMEVEQL